VDKITLGQICFIEKGKIGIQAAVPGSYPLVTTAKERGSHNEYHFEGEAVCIPLISATGHGHASIKRIHFQKGRFAVGNILCVCIPKDYNKTSAKFLHLYFSLLKDVLLVPLMQGSANVSLKIKDLEKVEIPNLSYLRQIQIVEEFERLEMLNNKLLTEFEEQRTYLQLLWQTILHEAVQGKLTKQNPTDEPA
jgi:type I restriction enzyme, S subunit